MYASQGKENEEKTIVILLCETPLDLESKPKLTKIGDF